LQDRNICGSPWKKPASQVISYLFLLPPKPKEKVLVHLKRSFNSKPLIILEVMKLGPSNRRYLTFLCVSSDKVISHIAQHYIPVPLKGENPSSRTGTTYDQQAKEPNSTFVLWMIIHEGGGLYWLVYLRSILSWKKQGITDCKYFEGS
jgi:hypothetical protein